SPQVPPKNPPSTSGTRAPGGSMLSPSPRGPTLSKSPFPPSKAAANPLSAPKLKLTIPDTPDARKDNSPAGTERTNSVVYGSDIIRRPTLQRPVLVHRAPSTSTMGMISPGTTSSYTGPDLRYVSMGSHSVPSEPGDYSAAPPRNTGFYRTSILNPPRPGPELELPTRASNRQGDGETRTLSAISFEPWVKVHDFRADAH
ncbi:hypothetical protein FRC09_017130, partial [Ceratobasidium sp. 395]